MTEIETFDPRIFSSPSALVEALQGLNIVLSQRLGVRIFAMGAQRIQFSLAILEMVAQTPSLQNELASPKLGLAGASDPAKRSLLATQLSELLEAEVLQGELDENGLPLLQVVSQDEAMLYQLSQQQATSPGRGLMTTTQSQALPRLLGNQAQYLPKGSTFDRNKLEMAAQRLLDSENVATLVEDFRYLFRASVTLRQNPSSLLECALTREKPELSREVATAIKEHLDNSLGSLLLDLFGDDPEMQLQAVGRLSKLEVLPEARILTALSRNLWASEPNREGLLLSAASWGSALRLDPSALQHLLDLFLGSLDEMLPAQKARLHDMLLSWSSLDEPLGGGVWEDLWLELGRRGEAVTRDFRGVSLQLFLIRLFHSRVGSSGGAPLDGVSEQLQQLSESWMQEILRDWGERAGILERAALVLEMMSDEFLCALLPFDFSGSWSEMVQTRLYFAALDRVCLHLETVGSSTLESCLSDFCFERLLHRQKTVTLAISRGQNTNLVVTTSQPCWFLQEHFSQRLARAELSERLLIGDFLADLIRVVEAPDDDRLFLLLSKLEWTQVVSARQRLMDNVQRGGGGAAVAFWFFCKLLYSRFVNDCEQSQVLCQVHFKQSAEDLAGECLSLPLFAKQARPHTWLGLGFLGSWPSLSIELRREVFELLLKAADLATGHLGEEEWKALASSIQRLHLSGSAALAVEIEQSLVSRLEVEPGVSQRAQTPPNLSQALDLLICMADQGQLGQPLPLLSMLSRRLAAPPQNSLQRALLDALREDDGGDMSVQIRRSWDQEDLEKAVELCAILAREPVGDDVEVLRISELAATRLLAVTEDWLQRLGTSKESYASRSHCVWTQWDALLARGLTVRAQQSCLMLVQSLLSLHEKKPFQLGLRDRAEVLKFLYSWSCWCLNRDECAGHLGTVRAVVDLMGQLARPQEDDQHLPVAFHFLEKYSLDRNLSRWPMQVQAVVHTWRGLLIRPSN